MLSSTWAQNGKSRGPNATTECPTVGHLRSPSLSALDLSQQMAPDVPRSCGTVDGDKVGI